MADAIASASAAAAPYVDQATTMYATYLQPYVPTSFCSAAATLDVYVATLIAEFKGADYAALQASVVTGNVAASTMMLVGVCLVMAPVIFGRDWLSYIEVIVGLVGGIVGGSILMGGLAAPYIEIAYGYVSLAGEAKCAAGLAILLLCAFLFTYMVQKVKALLFFLVGAAGAGFGAYMSSGLVTPLIAAQLGAPIPDNYVLYACGGIGLLGGLLFGSLAEKLLDFVLGVFGSVVLAMGAINLALADFLTAELVATLKLEAYYMFYVGGIGAVLFLLRRSLVNVREPEKSLRGKGPPPRKGGRVAPSPPGANKSKMQARSKQMH